MSVGLGKFDGVEAIVGYSAMLDGWSTDTISFGEDSGEWAEKLDGTIDVANLRSLFGDDYRAKLLEECSHGGTRYNEHHGYECSNDTHDVPCTSEDCQHDALIEDVLDDLASCAGIIVTGDSNGFVYGESFATTDDLEREWHRLETARDDIERQAIAEEHSEWVRDIRYSDHDSDACDACAPVEGFAIGDVVNWQGVASRVAGFDAGNLILVMVGDDTRHSVDVAHVQALDDLDYCAECGQVGCAHDGRDRTETDEEG